MRTHKIKHIAALALTAILLSVSFCGCGNTDEDDKPAVIEAQPISDPGSTAEPSTAPSTPAVDPADTEQRIVNGIPVITNRVEKDGKLQSYLTGEWKDAAVAGRRPMAVMISNNKPALPQYGISYADVVVEAPMESGSCTRLMALFEDYDNLDHIGPVRSSRLYFLLESQSFDAIYCNWGLAVPYVAETINSDFIDNISAAVSGISDPSDEAFGRDENRKAAGYSTEYTGIMTISGYNSALKRQGYETTYRDRFEQNFLFAADGYKATYDDAPDVTNIYPGGNAETGGGKPSGYGHISPYFIYESDGLYHRYQNGAPQIDESNNAELTYTNVIVKLVTGFYADDNGYLFFEVRGEGDAVVFTNGKAVKATWKRLPDTEGIANKNTHATYYYDQNGEEIVLNQGKTWICLVWTDFENYLSYY